MNQQQSDMVNELLPRYCEGKVSQEERKIVEDWINQSEENYRVAKQIHMIYFPEIPGIVNTIYRRKSFEVYGYLFYTFGYKKRDYPNERDNLFSIW